MSILLCFLNRPVQRDGTEAEHCDRAEELVQELEGFAEQQSVQPPAAARAGAQHYVEGDAHQPSADPRAGQVLDEPVGDRLEDVCAAGAPQHGGVTCGEEQRANRFKRQVAARPCLACLASCAS